MKAETIFSVLVAITLFDGSRSGFSPVPRCPTMDDNPAGSICVCDAGDSFNGWMLSCLKSTFEPLFDLKYAADSDVTFRCGDEAPYKGSLLRQLDLTKVHTFTFKSCPLPDTSFYDILPDYRVKQLKIEMKSGERNFTQSIFTNVSSTMSSLILSNNKIENLPEDIFTEFSNLKFLSLSDNELETLPEKLLWPLTSLIVLEVTNNKLENLPENVFSGLFQLEKLYLYKNKLKRVPDTLFRSLVNLRVLDLADNQLVTLSEGVFVGLSQLRHVRLRGNQLESLPGKLFNYTAGLQDIDLSLNNFHEPLPEDLFHGLNSLENVSIHDCNLSSVHENFFSHCSNMTHLKLQNNRLRFLPESLFRNNSKLVEVDLNFNSIAELPENLFPGQKYLEKLYLFNNNISYLPNALFRHARNVKTLVLGHNRIKNASQGLFRDLPSLERIDLSNNNLSHFSLDFNENVKHIDLSYNSLTEMPRINWLQHLRIEVVNMEHNKLSSLSIPVLYSTNKRNPELNFGYNQIKTVDVSEVTLNDIHIQDLPSKDYENYVESTISLHPNPFVCDCRLFDFYNYLQNTNEARKRSVRFSLIQNLTCKEPTELATKRIILLSAHQFSCDLKEDCMAPCKCYLRAKDGVRVVDCSNRHMTRPPSLVPYNTSVLYFQNNSLVRADQLNDPIYRNLTSLFLDGNVISSVDGWVIPPKLVNLTLQRNRLNTMSSSLLNFTSQSKDFRISLSGNPWSCNCSTMYFKKWLTEHYQKVVDVKNVECYVHVRQNFSLVRMPVVTIPDDVICPVDDWPYKAQLISVTTICVILALLLFIVSVLYYRNKQTVIAYVYIHLHNVFMCFFNEEDIDEDKVFDAFVSYSSSDRDVAFKLLEELENKEPYFRLCIHERNWLPGNLISWNIINSVQNSRRTILVISKEFLESMWFQVEFHTAYYQMLEDKIDRLIVIVKGELPPKNTLDKDLQYLLSTKTYLVWEEKWFWEKLRYAMPHKKQEIVGNDVLALKDRPDSKKLKTVENQIAVLSSVSPGDKTSEKAPIQNGTAVDLKRLVAPPRLSNYNSTS